MNITTKESKMAKFQKGSRVIREDTQRKGVISQVFDEIRGRQIYLVNWGDSESASAKGTGTYHPN